MSPAARRHAATGTRGALRFYVEVVGLEHLHYGLWDGEDLNLEGLKAAQRRHADHVADLIGPEVRSILDCGCGIGATARLLTERGYEVEGLSPDPYQQEQFPLRTGLVCRGARFQEFVPPRPYDLVLNFESCHTIPLRALPGKLREVAPGGQWLISDYFTLREDGSKLTKSGHPLAPFRRLMEEAGFELTYEEDITEQVLPTLDLVRAGVDDRLMPAARMLSDRLAERHPWLYPVALRLARALFRKQIRRAEEQRILIDSDAFRAVKRYLILRYRVPPAGA